MSSDLEIRACGPVDVEAISKLHARAFGPGRFARTAYRVREGTQNVTPHCRVAYANGALVAALHATPITIGGRPGALLLGPIAVDPDVKGRKFGQEMIARALADAARDGFRLALLVGDEPLLRPLRFCAHSSRPDPAAGAGQSGAAVGKGTGRRRPGGLQGNRGCSLERRAINLNHSSATHPQDSIPRRGLSSRWCHRVPGWSTAASRDNRSVPRCGERT